MKKKIILLLLVCLTIFVFYKRHQLNKLIKSKEMSLYLDFDSFTRQFGYPEDKQEFYKFIDYCENVVGYKNEIWENDYYLKNSDDSVKVFIKSKYYLKDINILSVKKRVKQ